MKNIEHLETIDKNKLICTFNDSTKKIADLANYLQSPAFAPLLINNHFKQATNKGHYVEWAFAEVDISADTLWNIGY